MFSALGRAIVRHPWYPVIGWIVLLVVVIPFLPLLGSVTTNSATTLPDSAPSQIASSEIQRLFPNQSAGSDSLLLFTGTNVTNQSSQSSIQAVTAAVAADPQILYVLNASSVYTSYQGYLAGMTDIVLGTIGGAQSTSPPLTTAVNQSALLLWGPPALFVRDWLVLVAQQPATPPAALNPVANRQASLALGPDAAAQLVLNTFYNGTNGNGHGFNGTAGCAAQPLLAGACADNVTVSQVGPIIPTLVPNPADRVVPYAALAGLGVANYSSAASQRTVAAGILAPSAGLPPHFVDQVWSEFPNGVASGAEVDRWTTGVVANATLWSEPLPVPLALSSQFVNPQGTASLVVVTYLHGSGYTAPDGSTPIYDNVGHLNTLVPNVLSSVDPYRTLSFVQTGGAPLDQFESTDLSQNLAFILPLTIAILIGITIVYFRSPITPLVTFAGIGAAVGLALGGAVLLGTVVTKFDSTTLTLVNVFVLGVGTDYSIFLTARYREELFKGAAPKEAIVTAVTWAGQSVATSGATAVIATLALTFSGLALLSQWGMVLSLAVLMTILISLTLTPALLVLVGPRVFWPMVGARFDRQAHYAVERRSQERTYFYRAGRLAQRRPKALTALILVASIPLLYVALSVPLSYDFYGQLPSNHPATAGFAELGKQFGPGFAFPIVILVTWASPFLVGNASNATQFTQLGQVTNGITATSGFASVGSPVGTMGAPLGQWVTFSAQSPGTQAQLRGVLSGYVGIDGRTVLLTVVSTSGGLSTASVDLLKTLESYLGSFQHAHPSVVQLAYGGGASVTNDLSAQSTLSIERMALIVSIGLIVVLLAVLRSYAIPFLAVATIGLSIGWAWGITYLVLGQGLGYPIFYFVPTVLFILILGLGIDYNIFLLTRVREERLRGRSPSDSVVHAVASTGGIITAAAVILASAFLSLTTGDFLLLRAIGFAVATAVLLDAMVVRTYLMPSLLQLLGSKAWVGFRSRPPTPDPGRTTVRGPAAAETTPTTGGRAPESG